MEDAGSGTLVAERVGYDFFFLLLSAAANPQCATLRLDRRVQVYLYLI